MNSLPPIEPTIDQLSTLSVDSLTYEKRRIENSIFHLTRSNEEMKSFDEDDIDFKTAIKENEDYILKLRDKINIIQNILLERQQNGNLCIEPEPLATTDDSTQESNSIHLDLDTQETSIAHDVLRNNIENNDNNQSEQLNDANDGIYL
ncbi:682_t:CDS:2 [Acaulospora morrowiae]|uniref:682_t:CDS:1 n=1 Tax=Acaulospora morrowiae TaxID=94023 RepID=A0A9N9H8R6_9GLOM|nr:682_t:CDS:2 [Acaulospora morrowiae]